MTTNKSQFTLTTQWIVPDEKKSEVEAFFAEHEVWMRDCLLYTSPSPRDLSTSRMPSSA